MGTKGNALDGVLLTCTNINALCQHSKSEARTLGIVTHGGDAANVVPDRDSARCAVSSADKDYLEEVVARVEDCARGAALATGTQVVLERLITLENTPPNGVLTCIVTVDPEAQRTDF